GIRDWSVTGVQTCALPISVICNQQPDLQKQGFGIEQRRDALSRGHFSGAVLLLDARWAAARAQPFLQLAKLLHEQTHVRASCDVHSSLSVAWARRFGHEAPPAVCDARVAAGKGGKIRPVCPETLAHFNPCHRVFRDYETALFIDS